MRTSIRIQGCDGSTEFELDLDDIERAAVMRLANLSQCTSEYECEPTIHVKEKP